MFAYLLETGGPGQKTIIFCACAGQFARGGTDDMETPEVFQTPEVVRAGGLESLKVLGKPADVLRQTKERMFAA